jgi:hypothetical protein
MRMRDAQTRTFDSCIVESTVKNDVLLPECHSDESRGGACIQSVFIATVNGVG